MGQHRASGTMIPVGGTWKPARQDVDGVRSHRDSWGKGNVIDEPTVQVHAVRDLVGGKDTRKCGAGQYRICDRSRLEGDLAAIGEVSGDDPQGDACFFDVRIGGVPFDEPA
jgi:hypothetical protein